MGQVHETTPSGPAVFGVSPFAVLVFPDGWMYVIVHDAPGAVCIVALAVPPMVPPVTVRLDAPLPAGGTADPVAVADAAGAGLGDTEVAVLDTPLLVGTGEALRVGVSIDLPPPPQPLNAATTPRQLSIITTSFINHTLGAIPGT
jgi:hypothetical protein